MATPRSGLFAETRNRPRGLPITPGSRVLKSSLSDEALWKRLKEAGFDEESIKRRDKAALIAYIAKLESEVFDYQHNMGLLLLEKKELVSKCEGVKASAEEAELRHKRDQSAYVSALAEARKREESLKKDLGIAKECIASLEKTLHEMRAECAETKVSAGSKLSEAQMMIEDAQKKYTDAEAKMHAAEALQAEASRYHRIAERKLKEVEGREDDLARRLASFKSESEAKEREMILERQTLSERQKSLQQEHERLLDAQASLNQREDHIFGRSQELARLEKELESARAQLEEECRALNDGKSNLEVALASLPKREEAVFEREASLQRKEQELLVSQEKLASKESEQIQKVLANQESILRKRRSEVEAELETKRKLVEDEIESKRRAWELREVDISQREDLVSEREHDLEVQSRVLAEKEKDVTERSNILEEREKCLNATEKEIDLKKALLEKEQEEISKLKLDLQQSLMSLEDKKKYVEQSREKLEALKCETSELSILEMKLKEELDAVRSQKLELMAEADRLKVEKAKFEAEWEHIDVKREELRKEAEHIAHEREAFSRYLKDERDNLRDERDALRDQHKRDVEVLNCEREEFMKKMVHEHSEWLSKIQCERADFLLGIEMQKRELEYCIEKKREDLENNLREKEKAFEQEKKIELERIQFLKEMAEKELEQVTLELRRLDAERLEIKLDRERRDREWAELKDSIEELKVQREKLEKQRELLRSEREGIHCEVEELKKLENLKVALDDMSMAKMQLSNLERSWAKASAKRYLKQQTITRDEDLDSHKEIGTVSNGNGHKSSMQGQNDSPPPSSAPFSWIKRCTELIFKNSPEKSSMQHEERRLSSEILKVDSSKGYGENGKSEKAYCKRPVSTIERVQGGRKRRINNSSGNDASDPSALWFGNGNKKRKQNAILKLSEEADTHSVISSPPNVPQDKHELPSSNQEPSGAGETSVLVINEIVKIRQVTCETVGIGSVTDRENAGGSSNPLGDSDSDPNARDRADGTGSYASEAEGKMGEETHLSSQAGDENQTRGNDSETVNTKQGHNVATCEDAKKTDDRTAVA